MPRHEPETLPLYAHPDVFAARHIGPDCAETSEMLADLGFSGLDELGEKVVPESIRLPELPDLPAPLTEHAALERLRQLAGQNKAFRSHLGLGYYGTVLPPVIQRNVLENPGWYTQYTPYQPEISQGRLEALVNFQTMITDLTAMDIANASLLDEPTAAAEAMALCFANRKDKDSRAFFASWYCHPQTLAVLRTRAEALGIRIIEGDPFEFDFTADRIFGVLLQYPRVNGSVPNLEAITEKAHALGALVVVAADLLCLTILKPPGEFGADVVVGSTQRFGMPMGYGGPHAAFFATRDALKRQMPGRLVGVTKDAQGNPALRLSLQTREQHIRREKATSNICTAQVLPAVVASMYAVYHGPRRLREIALRIHRITALFENGMKKLGHELETASYFDTVTIILRGITAEQAVEKALAHGINIRLSRADAITVAFDETHSPAEAAELLRVLNGGEPLPFRFEELIEQVGNPTPPYSRDSEYLTHPVFNIHHSETEMLRYLKQLESRDLSLTHSMIPLGSCTMKLNATAEMLPITWEGFAGLHPFAPADQAKGYRQLICELEHGLAEITGFHGVSLQPNAGSQGEYAGLLVIRAYQQSRGEGGRDVCLIPTSAHGTNPASAVMAGLKVVPVKCSASGDIDLDDLRAKASQHTEKLAAIMITYPSTHGVFEDRVQEVCAIVHEHGGQIYLDGANMNAQVGLCSPATIGADVCHLNLHKTFSIPHGGGGPGVGPIAVAEHLSPFLPGHPLCGEVGGDRAIGPVSAAPWGSSAVLPISWAYIVMMGSRGLRAASLFSILGANYIAKRLDPYYPVLYKGPGGLVAHECIIDLRQFKPLGIEVDDVAKRLMDYGFHAPTMSWPVPGTMMIEPTESESKTELDRFCDAMIAIHGEIMQIESGEADREDNLLKNAPHTALATTVDEWPHPYSRERAAFPAENLRDHKFWPAVGRIDNVFGDRNLFCSCVPVEGMEF